MKILYTAIATATGGRDGRAVSSDGQLDITLATPKEIGGPGGGTNPEQLLAAGWAACFCNAIQLVGKRMELDTADASVTAEIGLGPAESGVGYALTAVLRIELPELETEKARELVERTHKVCPFSNAMAGNVPTELVVE